MPDIVARAGPAVDSLSTNVTVMRSSAIRTPLEPVTVKEIDGGNPAHAPPPE